jgi:hypothetical protein
MNLDIMLRAMGIDKQALLETADGFGARMERLEKMVSEIHDIICSDKKDKSNGTEKTDAE